VAVEGDVTASRLAMSNSDSAYWAQNSDDPIKVRRQVPVADTSFNARNFANTSDVNDEMITIYEIVEDGLGVS
jgi:hypothetical protein